jgi:predicted ATPase
MIERLAITNFKSIRHAELRLGPFNLLIGPNAGGKSNLLDALRVLQGAGSGFTVGEIFDGKPRSATAEVWDGIRGGSGLACFSGAQPGGEVVLEAGGTLEGEAWEYRLGLVPGEGRVSRESLTLGRLVYDSEAVAPDQSREPALSVRLYHGKRGRQPHASFERSRPILGQLAALGTNGTRQVAEAAAAVARLLADSQRLDPWPAILRGYSQAHRIRRMGEHGENFAALVRTICDDPGAKDAYLGWLKELRPAELDDVGFLAGAMGEPLFVLHEGGHRFPAPVLSDGTLRFAAITAAFFQPDMPRLLTLEEVENGVHASRVRLLVELLRARSATGETLVMATTHSPAVLEWLTPAEYATTFYCHRDEDSAASIIRPLTEVPRLRDAVAGQSLGDLFSEGWLETAP